MTVSPFNTLQEQQLGRPHAPWRILVCCMLLNRTHGRQVRPMVDQLFAKWPEPLLLSVARSEEVIELIRPLGFSKQRQRYLEAMSYEYGLRESFGKDFWKNRESGEWARTLTASCTARRTPSRRTRGSTGTSIGRKNNDSL